MAIVAGTPVRGVSPVWPSIITSSPNVANTPVDGVEIRIPVAAVTLFSAFKGRVEGRALAVMVLLSTLVTGPSVSATGAHMDVGIMFSSGSIFITTGLVARFLIFEHTGL